MKAINVDYVTLATLSQRAVSSIADASFRLIDGADKGLAVMARVELRNGEVCEMHAPTDGSEHGNTIAGLKAMQAVLAEIARTLLTNGRPGPAAYVQVDCATAAPGTCCRREPCERTTATGEAAPTPSLLQQWWEKRNGPWQGPAAFDGLTVHELADFLVDSGFPAAHALVQTARDWSEDTRRAG